MTRLSIRILALGLVLWQLQSAVVQAQRYYMNFAFNNNQPNGGESGSGEESGGDDAGSGAEGSGVEGSDDEGSGSGSGGGSGSGSGSGGGSGDDGGSGAGGSALGSGGDGGSGAGSGAGSAAGESGENVVDQEQNDVDADDSDSHDTIDRRTKMRAAAETGGRPANDHSHHSSYEISIDDSYGGRYVRSIYESSESHGHSGSQQHSGSRQSLQADASEQVQNEGQIQQRRIDDYDYEEPSLNGERD